jgi:thiamine phosphate phosphatase / amino-HMP aminohydrolase
MAEDCAADDDERDTIAALRKAVLQELSLHASVLQVPPNPNSSPSSSPVL